MNKSSGRLARLKTRLDCIDKPQWGGSSNLKYTRLQREALSSPTESSGEPPSLESMATGSHRMFYKESGCNAESGPLSRELSMEQLGPTTLSPALCGLQPPGFTPSWSSWPALSGEEGLLWKEGPWELVSRRGNESETPG